MSAGQTNIGRHYRYSTFNAQLMSLASNISSAGGRRSRSRSQRFLLFFCMTLTIRVRSMALIRQDLITSIIWIKSKTLMHMHHAHDLIYDLN